MFKSKIMLMTLGFNILKMYTYSFLLLYVEIYCKHFDSNEVKHMLPHIDYEYFI